MRLFLLTTLLICPLTSMALQAPIVEEEPPEEDVDAIEKQEYVLNPLQASREMRVGNFYFKKGSYKAAARRFEEATKWNPGDADAWYRLGEAHLKLRNTESAITAWTKYLEVSPDGKQAADVRRRLEKLNGEQRNKKSSRSSALLQRGYLRDPLELTWLPAAQVSES